MLSFVPHTAKISIFPIVNMQF